MLRKVGTLIHRDAGPIFQEQNDLPLALVLVVLSEKCLKRAFDARLPLAESFARWFMSLYELPQRQTSLP